MIVSFLAGILVILQISLNWYAPDHARLLSRSEEVEPPGEGKDGDSSKPATDIAIERQDRWIRGKPERSKHNEERA